MLWSASVEGMADLTSYFNHVIALYTGIQTVPHVHFKWGRLLKQARTANYSPGCPSIASEELTMTIQGG